MPGLVKVVLSCNEGHVFVRVHVHGRVRILVRPLGLGYGFVHTVVSPTLFSKPYAIPDPTFTHCSVGRSPERQIPLINSFNSRFIHDLFALPCEFSYRCTRFLTRVAFS